MRKQSEPDKAFETVTNAASPVSVTETQNPEPTSLATSVNQAPVNSTKPETKEISQVTQTKLPETVEQSPPVASSE